MKKYFIYQLKKSLLPLALLTLFMALVYAVPAATHNYSLWNSSDNEGRVNLYTAYALSGLAAMCVVMPFFIFSYKMNKRSVDMYYSLPLSRTKLTAVNFICGFICVYAAFTAGYLLGFIIIAAKVRRLYLITYLWIYIASVIPAFTLYSISSFLYTRANSVVDGIAFVAMGMFSLVAAGGIINSVLEAAGVSYNISAIYFLPGWILNDIGIGLGNRIYNPSYTAWEFDVAYNKWRYLDDIGSLIGGIVTALLAVAAAVGLILSERHAKAENCKQISESVFGYKVMIPLMMLACAAASGRDIVMLCIIAFGGLIATILYRRTIKIGKKHGIRLAVYIAAMIALVFILFLIENLK